MLYDTLCLGHITLDHRMKISNYPINNSGTYIFNEIDCIGGDAAIVASNLSNMGYSTYLSGNILCNDKPGRTLRALLKTNNVKVSTKEAKINSKTSETFVFVDPEGLRTWFEKATVSEAPADKRFDLRSISKKIKFKTLFLDSFLFNHLHLDSNHIDKDLKIFLHCSPITRKSLIKSSFVVCRSLSDKNYTNINMIIKDDLKLGVKLSIMMEGKNGCTFGSSSGLYKLKSHTVNAIDTTGAGATFMSGLIYAYLNDMPVNDFCKVANALAACKITKFGNLECINFDHLAYNISNSEIIKF